jgi:glycosyltransferase involved in cell wall biosynthesis
MSSSSQIKVSVITPTFNRGPYIRRSIECYRKQTFPLNQMEWIILDDGTEPIEAILLDAAEDIPNIRYIRDYKRQTIGAKRNRLNKEARAPIIVSWDDDDYYPPERIEHIVKQFDHNPKIQLAGSSKMFFYFADDKSIWSLGPFAPYHSSNGPLAYRQQYTLTHKYDESVAQTEEPSFLNNYTESMIQLDPYKSILVMVHTENTVAKDVIRKGNPAAKKTVLHLEAFIQDKTIRGMFA